MSGIVDITLLGDKALARKLARLPGVTQKKIVRKALRQGARPVLAAAKRLCPVRYGVLKGSLKLRTVPRKRGLLGVEVSTGTRTELGIPESDPGYYPMSVEYGHGRVAAQPFLRPALDENRDRAKRIIGQRLGRDIEAEAKKP